MKKLLFTLILVGTVVTSFAQIEVSNFTAYTQTVYVQYENVSNPCVIMNWQGTIISETSIALPVASGTRALSVTAAPVIPGCTIPTRSNRAAYDSVGPCPKASRTTGKATCNGVGLAPWSVIITGSIPVGPGSSIEIF